MNLNRMKTLHSVTMILLAMYGKFDSLNKSKYIMRMLLNIFGCSTFHVMLYIYMFM